MGLFAVLGLEMKPCLLARPKWLMQAVRRPAGADRRGQWTADPDHLAHRLEY